MTKKKTELTQEKVHELFTYDEETGIFKWKKRINPAIKLTLECGSNSHGYLVVRVNKRLYAVHNLIWLWKTGEYPTHLIDHVNRIRNDNRWSNLRPATKKDNIGNSKLFKHNTSGQRGVSFDKERNKWSAFIHRNGKKTHLGRYNTKEEAASVYNAAALKHFGEFYCV